MQAVATLPLPQQLDALRGYNELSAAFMAWLRTLTASGHYVVTEADVRGFFDRMQEERRSKRRRLDEGE